MSIAKKILYLGPGQRTRWFDRFFRTPYQAPPVGDRKRNAGDKAFVGYFCHFIKDIVRAPFHYMNIRRPYAMRDIRRINQHRAAIVGGGGLFLFDSVPNDISDWQWLITPELINAITTPLVVFSIGYNQFRGQRAFTPAFDASTTALVRKAAFFSMRHTGDIEKFKKHLPPELHPKIVLNFCPTLLYNDEVFKYKRQPDSAAVGFTVAGDRLQYRHKNLPAFIAEIKNLVRMVQQEGKTAVLIRHTKDDAWIKEHIAFDRDLPLIEKDAPDIYRAYADLGCVFTDRGHGQMLPFSVGTPVISYISHDKLKFFLDDVAMPELGIEENEPHLAEKCFRAWHNVTSGAYGWDERWRAAMQKIHHVNDTNRDRILSII